MSTSELNGIVLIKKRAFNRMLHHALEHANRLKWNWKEVYGLLIGYNKGNHVLIENAVPVTHGSSIHVQFSIKDYIFAANINDLLVEKTNKLFFVGWYHSHPGLGLFLSGTDIVNHLGFQNLNPLACAIVFDHTLIEQGHRGYEVFRLSSDAYGYYTIKNRIVNLRQNKLTKLKPIEEIYYKYTHLYRKKRLGNSEKEVRKNLENWLFNENNS
ncbi:MAG: hypothetical protein ACTSVY_03330 [Candidatus Helarchaeota archaeon]